MSVFLGTLFIIYSIKNAVFFYRRRSWKTLFLLPKKGLDVVTWKNSTWKTYILSLLPAVFYNGALIGVVISNGICEHQRWTSASPTFFDLLSSDNFQGILLSVLCMISGRSFLKLIPSMINSYLHLSYKDKCTDNGAVSAITLKNSHLLHVVAYSEIVVLLKLLFDAMLWKDGTSGFVLIFYIAIYWLKVNFSPYAQASLLRILLKLDKKVPDNKRKRWNMIKSFIFRRMREREATFKELR